MRAGTLSDRIADYEVIAELARSASGRILIAQAPGSKRLLAIKEMLIEQDAGLSVDEQVARFKREADIHLQLNHPNIIKAYDAGVDGDRHYLVMEYQPGGNWHAVMEERRRSPIPQVLEWGIQLCNALQHLHEQGVVHRDVKPANCLISPAGQLKLTDFGMARRAFAPGITQAKMMLGTLNYMSPEQLLDATSVDGRSDVFAAGVILFKAFTGELPFAGETPTDVAHRLLYAEPTDALSLNPRLPKSLGDKLLKCLSKDPDYRYLSAEAFAKDLEEELHRTEIYLAQGYDHAEHAEWKDANHCFQQAIAMDSANADAWFQLGESLHHLGQPEQASECYLKVIHLNSSHIEAYRRLGEAYLATKNHPAAIKMLQRAWVLEPKDRDVCMALAMTYREMEQFQEAIEQLGFLVEQHPDWARAHFELGRARYAADRPEEALVSFRAAHRHAPTDPDVLFNLASLLHELGMLEDAEEHYEKLIVLTPDRPYTHAHHNLACLWLVQGRLAEAEAQVQAVLAQEQWGPSYLLLGEIFERTARMRDAIEVYRAAIELMPDHADAYISLARVLQRTFQPNAAIDLLRVAAERLAGDRALLLYHLALALRTRGDTLEATDVLTRCIAERPAQELAKAAEGLLAAVRPAKPGKSR
ncbi:tetratricopeptide repeat protein [bacterium]|nr:tetratricopeptide repeat protein [bacterium]